MRVQPNLPPSFKTRIPGQCRWCAQPILKNGQPNRRRLWHPECISTYLEITRPISVVRKRDHGVCAKCGLDTVKIQKKLRQIRIQEGMQAFQTAQLMLPWKMSLSRAPWEADHIRPVWSSGGDLEFFKAANLQCLCLACHKTKSKKDAQDFREFKKTCKQQETKSSTSPITPPTP